MESQQHLLLLEDDADISVLIQCFMEEHSFRVSVAQNGKALDRILVNEKIDLILVDLMLPGEHGLSICRRIRSASNVPIIIVTALGAEADRVSGLEIGADDYLTKPFSSRELLARVRAVLRRSRLTDFPGGQTAVFVFDNWRLSLAIRKLWSPNGVLVPLTSGELSLLTALCQHPGTVLSREQLLDLTQGRAPSLFDRSIDIQISRLRRKIEPDPKKPSMIITVRNGGYMFTCQVSAASEF